jgi:hypothetical protein
VAPRSDYSCWTAKEPKCKLCNGFGFDPLRLPLGAVKCKCQIKTPDYGKLQTTASECEYGCTDGKIVIPHGFLGKEVHDCPIHKEEPKYRPYKDASEVPVPFVFRIGNTSRRIYPQYVSANGIAYRAPDTGYVILIEYEELFKQCIQHNGEPCGIRI